MMRKMMNKYTQVVIFSKDRAMQLDLCLNTLYKSIADVGLPLISVLYKASEKHKKSYETLKNEHPYVEYVEEKNFKSDLLKIVQNKRFVLFVTDDTVFVRKFYIRDFEEVLNVIPSALGISLRLGENTQYCYPLNAQQRVPKSYRLNYGLNFYHWLGQNYDFGYPLELSSSMYRVADIDGMLSQLDYNNPNELEALMFQNCQVYERIMPFLVFPRISFAFANPINRVQNVAPANRFGNNAKYDPYSLLTDYENGCRIDYTKFEDFVTTGAHQEIDVEYGENTNV